VVALDDAGRPKFYLLQTVPQPSPRIRYFIFDLLNFQGHDLTGLPLTKRRKLLDTIKLKSKRIQNSQQFGGLGQSYARGCAKTGT